MRWLRFKSTKPDFAGFTPSILTVPALSKHPSLLTAKLAIFRGLRNTASRLSELGIIVIPCHFNLGIIDNDIFCIICIFGSIRIGLVIVVLFVFIFIFIFMEKILVFCSDKAFAVVFFSIFHDIPCYRFRIDLKVVSANSSV